MSGICGAFGRLSIRLGAGEVSIHLLLADRTHIAIHRRAFPDADRVCRSRFGGCAIVLSNGRFMAYFGIGLVAIHSLNGQRKLSTFLWAAISRLMA